MESVVSLRDATWATNMRFEDGVACNSPGYQAVTMDPTPDGPINMIGQANLSSELVNISTRSPIIGTTLSLYAQNGSSGYLRVFAGADQLLYNAATASLAATFVDTFGNGTSTPTFLWSQLSGPSATIDHPTNQAINLSGMAPGASVFQVKATDASGTSATASVKITILYVGGPAFEFGLAQSSNYALSVPSNNMIYLGTGTNGSVLVYNPESNSIVTTILGFPFNAAYASIGPMVYNASDGFLYVLTLSVSAGNAYLAKVDPSTNTIISTLQLPQYLTPNATLLTPSNKLVLTGLDVDTSFFGFLVIDLTAFTTGSFQPIGTISAPLRGIAYNSSNGLIYSVQSSAGPNIYIYSFDPVALTITKIDTGYPLLDPGMGGTIAQSFSGVAYSPLDNSLYFGVEGVTGDGYGENLFRWNLATTTLTEIGTFLRPLQLFYEKSHKLIYFIDQVSGFIFSYNPVEQILTNTNSTVGFSPTPAFSQAIGFSQTFNSLYSANGTILYAINAP